MVEETSPAEERRYAELQRIALDAARVGDGATLLPMLSAGLPPNLKDLKGNSLLMLAAYHGHADLAHQLLEAGARVDEPNDRGQTPLGGVAFKGYTDVAEVLIRAGADLEANNGAGMTPLMFAAMFGRHAMVSLLEREGASRKARTRFGLPASWLVGFSRIWRRARRVPNPK